MKNTLIGLLIFISFFSSCGKTDEKKRELKSQKRVKLMSALCSKYSAQKIESTILWTTTLYYQNLISKNERFIISDFSIDDVERTDSNYLISINCGMLEKQHFTLSSTETLTKKMFPDFPEVSSTPTSNYNEEIFLIVRLKSVKKIKYRIDSGEDNTKDQEIAEDTFDFMPSNPFLFRGELIDVFINHEVAQ